VTPPTDPENFNISGEEVILMALITTQRAGNLLGLLGILGLPALVGIVIYFYRKSRESER
jgi:hypothetical protein